MGKCLVHTVGALLINGHYGCRGAWPGQLTLCIRNKKKQINIKEAQFLFAAFFFLNYIAIPIAYCASWLLMKMTACSAE